VQYNQFFSSEPSEQDFSFWDEIKSLDCFSIVHQDLKELENSRLKKWMTHKNFVIFGTGGSSLGGQCIQAISSQTTVKFVSNLSPSALEKTFLDINPNETGFLCISKSGETLETIYQTLLALNITREKDKFVVITENKKSSLKEIAHEFDFLCLDHPTTIGGRFSVFSIVGMLPALLCGIDPMKITSGGKKVLEFLSDNIKKGASFVVENLRDNLTNHVSFIYSDKLEIFGEWLAQLYAESTGKSGVGVTPITAIGSVDQHSQLQLYLDGRQDKCFTFFFEDQETSLAHPQYLPTSFSYLKNRTAADVFKAQCEATIASIGKYRKITMPAITPEILGELFMHFMLEVTCVCKLIGVNPFDQPAVEQGKILTKKILSGDLC